VNGDLVVFGPPLTTTEAQVREIVDALKKAINTYFK
jgi:adenosylmethionine-8-amino-7-oxononanoate aminotransferase